MARRGRDDPRQRGAAPSHGAAPRDATHKKLDVDAVAGEVLATVQGERANWQTNHIRAETERFVRREAAVPDFQISELDKLFDHVLSPTLSVALTPRREIDEPAQQRRSDGTSVYEVAGSTGAYRPRFGWPSWRW